MTTRSGQQIGEEILAEYYYMFNITNIKHT